jgi:serine/threonine protein kinase
VAILVNEMVEAVDVSRFARLFKSEHIRPMGRELPPEEKKVRAGLRSMVKTWLPTASTDAELEAGLTRHFLVRALAALTHLHYHCGLVHHDLHAGNIMLSSAGDVVLIDWELAVPYALPFDPAPTVLPRNYGVRRGDQGIFCPSLFEGCSCLIPYRSAC